MININNEIKKINLYKKKVKFVVHGNGPMNFLKFSNMSFLRSHNKVQLEKKSILLNLQIMVTRVVSPNSQTELFTA